MVTFLKRCYQKLGKKDQEWGQLINSKTTYDPEEYLKEAIKKRGNIILWILKSTNFKQ